jgi:hypothetical protein
VPDPFFFTNSLLIFFFLGRGLARTHGDLPEAYISSLPWPWIPERHSTPHVDPEVDASSLCCKPSPPITQVIQDAIDRLPLTPPVAPATSAPAPGASSVVLRAPVPAPVPLCGPAPASVRDPVPPPAPLKAPVPPPAPVPAPASLPASAALPAPVAMPPSVALPAPVAPPTPVVPPAPVALPPSVARKTAQGHPLIPVDSQI